VKNVTRRWEDEEIEEIEGLGKLGEASIKKY